MTLRSKIYGGLAGLVLAVSVPGHVSTVTGEAGNYITNSQIAHLTEIVEQEREAAKKPRVDVEKYGEGDREVILQKFYDRDDVLRQERMTNSRYVEVIDYYYDDNNLRVLETMKRIQDDKELIFRRIDYRHEGRDLVEVVERSSRRGILGIDRDKFDYKTSTKEGLTRIDRDNDGVWDVVYDRGFPMHR